MKATTELEMAFHTFTKDTSCLQTAINRVIGNSYNNYTQDHNGFILLVYFIKINHSQLVRLNTGVTKIHALQLPCTHTKNELTLIQSDQAL